MYVAMSQEQLRKEAKKRYEFITNRKKKQDFYKMLNEISLNGLGIPKSYIEEPFSPEYIEFLKIKREKILHELIDNIEQLDCDYNSDKDDSSSTLSMKIDHINRAVKNIIKYLELYYINTEKDMSERKDDNEDY